MKSDDQEPQQEQEIEIPLQFSESNKLLLKINRLQALIENHEYEYNIEINKLIAVSQKYKEAIDKSSTKTKDSYYTSKLTKNNEKIFDMLVQFENSKNLLTTELQKLNDQLKALENDQTESPTV